MREAGGSLAPLQRESEKVACKRVTGCEKWGEGASACAKALVRAHVTASSLQGGGLEGGWWPQQQDWVPGRQLCSEEGHLQVLKSSLSPDSAGGRGITKYLSGLFF